MLRKNLSSSPQPTHELAGGSPAAGNYISAKGRVNNVADVTTTSSQARQQALARHQVLDGVSELLVTSR